VLGIPPAGFILSGIARVGKAYRLFVRITSCSRNSEKPASIGSRKHPTISSRQASQCCSSREDRYRCGSSAFHTVSPASVGQYRRPGPRSGVRVPAFAPHDGVISLARVGGLIQRYWTGIPACRRAGCPSCQCYRQNGVRECCNGKQAFLYTRQRARPLYIPSAMIYKIPSRRKIAGIGARPERIA
jgi:hypothetical protein